MGMINDTSDPGVLWAEIHRLRAALQGPDGYATWQDAAVAERVRRVKAETELTAARSAAQGAVQVPLTDAQRYRMWLVSDSTGNGGQIDWFIEGTRAAERHHGIGHATKEKSND